jgi:hypothetical protein
MTAPLSRLAAALALLIAAAPARAGDICKYLPGNTEIVVTVNVKQLLQSPLVQRHFLEKAKAELQKNEAAGKVLEALGIDPFADIDRVSGAMPAVDKQNDRVLIVVEGRFNADKVSRAADDFARAEPAKIAVQKVGAGKLYELKDAWEGKPIYAAVLSNDAIVYSPTRDLVSTSLERRGEAAPVKKELRDLVDNTSSEQSISVSVLASALGKGGGNEMARAIVAKLVNVTGGVTVGEDVQFEINVACQNAEAVQELRQMVNLGLGIATAQVGNNPALQPLADVLATVKVGTKGTAVQVKAQISKELIEKALKEVQK